MTPEMEAELGRAMLAYERAHGHIRLFPNPSGAYSHPPKRSKIDEAFGDGRKIADMGHQGFSLGEIAKAHGMSPASLNSWFTKHFTNLGKLKRKYPEAPC